MVLLPGFSLSAVHTYDEDDERSDRYSSNPEYGTPDSNPGVLHDLKASATWRWIAMQGVATRNYVAWSPRTEECPRCCQVDTCQANLDATTEYRLRDRIVSPSASCGVRANMLPPVPNSTQFCRSRQGRTASAHWLC